MKNYYLLSVFIFFLACSCIHSYENSSSFKEEFLKRKNQKLDTLIVTHDECTGCLDLTIIKGTFSYSKDFLVDSSYIHFSNDFFVCGNFPVDLIDMTSFNFDPNLNFKIIGKVVKIDTNNSVGKVPLFYVEKWERFYKSN